MLLKWMGKTWLVNSIVIFLLFTFCFYYYNTLDHIPFHPDESTYIYMSSDFKQLLSDPRGMAYSPGSLTDIKQHYRLIDPPLTRYWIGAALSIAGIDNLKVDWNWSLNWQANLERGALPDRHLLIVSRVAVSSFFLLALYAIFRTGLLVHNTLTGLLSIILLGTNALVLLHTRRAMEEALLLPAVCLSIWSFSSINRRPWAAGLAVMMAINVKLSSLPLYMIGIAAIFLLNHVQPINLSKRFLNLLIFTVVILAGTYLLNPIAWSEPWAVLQQAVIERNDLVHAQLASLQQINPDLALTAPMKRVAGLLTHTFFSFPAALDIGNYHAELASAIEAYDSTFGTALLRGITGGLITFFMTTFGSLLMLIRLLKKKQFSYSYRFVILVGFALFIAAMSITVSLPFQRYVIPLLPFVVLLSSFGISQVIQPDIKAPA